VSLPPQSTSASIEAIYRRDARKVFATLVRLLGDFDRAEEALHEAFRAALERWPVDGIPDNPSAWLVSAGRFKAIDGMRRDRRFTDWDESAAEAEAVADAAPPWDEQELLEDDRLRLVFTCCHPGLAEEARLALTLREVCGLTTEEIARAFLLPAPTLAQRIVRAKAKIRAAKIPYQVPDRDELPRRLASVLRVIYLVYNEGYTASSGESLMRNDLADEAIRLARLVEALLPEPEVTGLLALMLLQQSRRRARVDAAGDLVPLEAQDRAQWDRALIDEGCALAERALRAGTGPYALQAAISAVHAEARRAEDTDWPQIVGLYDALLRLEPSPVVQLNRAVAVGMSEGPAAGLALVEALLAGGSLERYHLVYAAKADFCRRLERYTEAQLAYRRALELVRQEPEKRFLSRRLDALPG